MCCINFSFIFCWEVKFRMDFKSLKLIIPFTTNTTPPRKTTYCLQVTYLVESEIKVIKNLPYKPRSSHNWTFSLLPQYEETRKNNVTSRPDAGQIPVHHFSPPPPTPYDNLSGITDTWLICIPIEKAQNNEPCQDREHMFAQNSGNRRSGEKITKLLCSQVWGDSNHHLHP